ILATFPIGLLRADNHAVNIRQSSYTHRGSFAEMQLSIRSQLGAVILLVIIFITTLLGIVAYNQSRKAIDDYAVRLVSATAENRRDMLLVHLRREREVAAKLLESIALACGPSGRVNGVCAHESLLLFLREEHALAGRVALTPKYSIQGGDIA